MKKNIFKIVGAGLLALASLPAAYFAEHLFKDGMDGALNEKAKNYDDVLPIYDEDGNITDYAKVKYE